MQAEFSSGCITLQVPSDFLSAWPDNDQVGIRGEVSSPSGALHLLLEKDFVCLDDTEEDQSDNYENPKANCI